MRAADALRLQGKCDRHRSFKIVIYVCVNVCHIHVCVTPRERRLGYRPLSWSHSTKLLRRFHLPQDLCTESVNQSKPQTFQGPTYQSHKVLRYPRTQPKFEISSRANASGIDPATLYMYNILTELNASTLPVTLSQLFLPRLTVVCAYLAVPSTSVDRGQPFAKSIWEA